MDRRWEGHRQALMRAARAYRTSDVVPPGFERRVLGRLGRSTVARGPVWGWVHALVRAAWASAGLTLLLAGAVWSLAPDRRGAEFEPDLETTLLAVMEEREGWRW